MASESIEERLRNHARAFDGLLSLIPAKYYYGEDTSDQWRRKKQTKEQARNAKLAKLNPDSAKSAKDVMDENARKRKRKLQIAEEGDGGENVSDFEGLELGAEQPREGLSRGNFKAKKQKNFHEAGADGESRRTINGDPNKDDKRAEKEKKRAEKSAAKREKRRLILAAKLEKKKAKAQQKRETIPTGNSVENPSFAPVDTNDRNSLEVNSEEINYDHDEDNDDIAQVDGFSLELKQNNSDPHPKMPSSATHSRTFGESNPQYNSSSISFNLPQDTDASKAAQDEKPLKATSEELKERLQKRLAELRAARHADGLNGKPARSRQELIEARRQKEEKRREQKKEMRQKAKEEEQRLRDEAIAKRFSTPGSGSLLVSPGSPADSIGSISNNFSFGRVVFGDGQQADPTLATVQDTRKQRGPQDPSTALKAAEAKKARISGLDEAKRVEIEEKDMWLNAKKKAHGERVKDDMTLLKKTLQRKQSSKKKSEREWKERLEGVSKGKEMRQAKREENLKKRRDERANKGKNKGKAKPRPGFEGTFKAKTGGKKK